MFSNAKYCKSLRTENISGIEIITTHIYIYSSSRINLLLVLFYFNKAKHITFRNKSNPRIFCSQISYSANVKKISNLFYFLFFFINFISLKNKSVKFDFRFLISSFFFNTVLHVIIIQSESDLFDFT